MSGTDLDRIEREILIDAPIERVWQLVSQPGWWIGDGDRSSHVITHHEDVVVVDDPRYGRFPILRVSSDAPRYAAFRASDDSLERPAEGNSTLLEFFLTETDGGTLLRVLESGFASLSMPAEERAAVIEDNTKGWETQLGVAKRDTEHVSA